MSVWKNLYKQLEDVDIDNFLSNPTIRLTMDLREYPKEAMLILDAFDNIGRVLEVGCGYGGLCKELKPYTDNYDLLDHSIMIKLAKRYLERIKGIGYYELSEKDFLWKMRFDLLICNSCLPEISISDQEYIYDSYFPYCKKVFIIAGVPDEDGEFSKRLQLALKRNFDVVSESNHYKHLLNIKRYIGIKNET